MDNRKISVLVTGIGGGGHGEQIVKALQMADTKYEIVGCDMFAGGLALHSIDHPYVLPPTGDPNYLEILLALCRKHKVQALFHGSEPELKIISKNRTLFQQYGILLPINTEEIINLCMNKFETAETLRRAGFKVPLSVRIKTMSDLGSWSVYPAVIKPSIGGGGSINLHLVQCADELNFAASQLLSLYGECVLQEYVGTPESEYTVGVLHDLDGRFINSIAVKRHIMTTLSNKVKLPNKSGRNELGPVLAISSGFSQGEIGPFPEVTKSCELIATTLGSRGPLNIQCRHVNGETLVFEINPRFSGTTSLRSLVGFNEPDILVRAHILGEKIVGRFPYKSGYIARGTAEKYVEHLDFPRAADIER